MSVSHPARIVLIGTMNPEEGELRPQLLDRFGLTVEVKASRDPAQRADVVRRRLAFDEDPVAFQTSYAVAQADVAARIASAQEALRRVRLSDWALDKIATVCAGFEVDGMRADIVTARAAVAHAAWEGRTDVTREDIRTAAKLALPTDVGVHPSTPSRDWTRTCSIACSATTSHRLRRTPRTLRILKTLTGPTSRTGPSARRSLPTRRTPRTTTRATP